MLPRVFGELRLPDVSVSGKGKTVIYDYPRT